MEPGRTSPIFVLCPSRSGSTLLRYILDTHAEVYCPPEPHLGKLATDLARLLSILGPKATDPEPTGILSEPVRSEIRDRLGGYMLTAARERGKQRWCDKSVTSATHAEILRELFPDARFVCLYRCCLDTVHSLLDATRYGDYLAYDAIVHVLRHPDQTLDGLVDYWTDTSRKILTFEQSHPDICVRVTYEALVDNPSSVAQTLFSFLGMSPDPELLERVFASEHEPGPGDHKIRSKRRIDASSVGQGAQLPVEYISDALRNRASELSDALGYPRIGVPAAG